MCIYMCMYTPSDTNGTLLIKTIGNFTSFHKLVLFILDIANSSYFPQDNSEGHYTVLHITCTVFL